MEKTELGDFAVLAALAIVFLIAPKRGQIEAPAVGVKDIGGHDASAEGVRVAE